MKSEQFFGHKTLAVYETWLKPSISSGLVALSGYSLFRNDCLNKAGGGVPVYVKDGLKASQMDASPEAIQVVECVDGTIAKEPKLEKVRKLKTIYHTKDGPSLEHVLLDKDVKDLTILVFAIAGKTRTGKSTLLNIMIEYLENKSLGEQIPNGFPWLKGKKSVTRGLWICPKIFRMKDCNGEDVGIMLLDAEGMNDSESTDGESIAMAGVSAAISHLQMFNVKELIEKDILQSIIAHLIKGIEDQFDSKGKKEFRDDYQLMFIVRDWHYPDTHPYGGNGGEDYIQQEKTRGSEENRALWEHICMTFHAPEAYLLPFPGSKVYTSEFCETGSLQLVEEEFVHEGRKLMEFLFHPSRLIPRSTRFTGQDIFNILTRIDGKIANDDLSFLNINTDHNNATKVENWKFSYLSKFCKVELSGLKKAKSEMHNILEKAAQGREMLMGKSRDIYLNKLKQALEGHYNQQVVDICIFNYQKSSFDLYASIEKQHSGMWPDVNKIFHKYICGDNTTIKNNYLILIKEAAKIYYSLLREEFERKFKETCSKKQTLAECAGLDKNEIKHFKECEDFTLDIGNKEELYPLWLKEYNNLKKKFTNVLLERVEAIAGISLEVLERLRRIQYEHFESLTLLNTDNFNFHSIPSNNKVQLGKKVGYAMFGLPESIKTVQRLQHGKKAVPNCNAVGGNHKTGYSTDQEAKIDEVVDKIISLSTSVVEFSCVFVVYDQKENSVNVPVFRIKNGKDIKYVDSNCRLYKGWNDFIKSNTLPDILYSYPLNGQYIKSQGFWIGFSRTPASKKTTKILKGADTVGKCVTGAAGVAGVIGLVFSAPATVPIAIVGGLVGGVYGMVRGVNKIRDKKKHDEPVTITDYSNVAANTFVVVGGAGVAVSRGVALGVEATLLLGARIFSAATCFAALITDSKETEELISLIASVEDTSLKMLFYFGSTCSKEALNVIQQSLGLAETHKADETLMALLENNCIESAVETESGRVRFEKYVSHSTAILVTSILRDMSSDVKDIVSHYCKLLILCQDIGEDRLEFSANKIKEAMRNLMLNFDSETDVSKQSFTRILCQQDVSYSEDISELILDKLGEGNNFNLAFRHLVCSLTSEVRKANYFFNNIEHDAITLRDYYVKDVLCHPLREISQQLTEMLEQKESTVDLTNYNVDKLNAFLLKVWKLLCKICDENSPTHQFENCLNHITRTIIDLFKSTVNHHKALVGGNKKLSCNDLDQLIEEIGFDGYNYGWWVGEKVLEEIIGVIEPNIVSGGRKNLTVMPAWSGITENLHFYSSTNAVVDKLDLVMQIVKIQKEIYEEYILPEHNLTVYKHSDDSLDLTTFIVYSERSYDKTNEKGFILAMCRS